MTRLFGTDGVRGVANKDLTPELALRLGRAAGHVLGGPGHRVVVWRDTRRSGRMLESALAAGLCSVGMEVRLVGHIPTPGLAYLGRTGYFVAAVPGPSVQTELPQRFPFDRPSVPLELAPEGKLPQDMVLVPHTAANGSYSVMFGLAYGKPLLASDLPCFREIHEHGLLQQVVAG